MQKCTLGSNKVLKTIKPITMKKYLVHFPIVKLSAMIFLLAATALIGTELMAQDSAAAKPPVKRNPMPKIHLKETT